MSRRIFSRERVVPLNAIPWYWSANKSLFGSFYQRFCYTKMLYRQRRPVKFFVYVVQTATFDTRHHSLPNIFEGNVFFSGLLGERIRLRETCANNACY